MGWAASLALAVLFRCAKIEPSRVIEKGALCQPLQSNLDFISA